jgi:hypothetical protein
MFTHSLVQYLLIAGALGKGEDGRFACQEDTNGDYDICENSEETEHHVSTLAKPRVNDLKKANQRCGNDHVVESEPYE